MMPIHCCSYWLDTSVPLPSTSMVRRRPAAAAADRPTNRPACFSVLLLIRCCTLHASRTVQQIGTRQAFSAVYAQSSKRKRRRGFKKLILVAKGYIRISYELNVTLV